MPYFSVIIPCLNEEKYLPRLLNDLNQQTFQDFEVHVVDGNSEDKTLQVAKKFPAKYLLNVIVSKKRNVSHQRNAGAHAALGKIYIFFDADTQIPKNYLEKVKHAFEVKRPHLLTTWMKPDSKEMLDRSLANGHNLLFESSRLINKPIGVGAMIAVKRGAFEDIGGFDEQTPYGEDTQFLVNVVAHNYKYIILPTPRYTFSFRRYHREGTIEAMRNYVKLSINLLIEGYHNQKPNYQMGGLVLGKNKKNVAVKQFSSTIKQLKKATKEQQRSIQKTFNQLFK